METTAKSTKPGAFLVVHNGSRKGVYMRKGASQRDVAAAYARRAEIGIQPDTNEAVPIDTLAPEDFAKLEATEGVLRVDVTNG